MKNSMTYVEALTAAIETITDAAVTDRLSALRETLTKRGTLSDEAKAKRSAKAKEATAKARAEMCAQVIPVLRDVITTDMTAKEIFAAAQDRLPEGFTAPKVQNILLREMKDELVKTETKGKANTYRRA